MSVNKHLAQCISSGTLYNNFQSFMNQCITAEDSQAINNVLNPNDFKTIIDNERAKQDDLMASLQGIASRAGPNSGASDTVQTANNLQSQLAEINKKIQKNEREADAQNQIFLERVTDAPKKTNKLANLQDVTLGVFFISLLILTIVITIIQYAKKDGSFKRAGFTFLVMCLVILILYALLKEVA